MDTRAEALRLAEECGADRTVTSGPTAAEEIREATGGRGADVVLDFVGADATLALGVAAARTVGDLTIVGIGGGTVAVSFFSVPYEVSIATTYWGSRPELVEVLDLGARGLVRPRTTTFAAGRRPRRVPADARRDPGGPGGDRAVSPADPGQPALIRPRT